jgi:uncharacterized membrane protein
MRVQQLVLDLQAESRLDEIYLILIVGSCAIATLGLLSDSTAVIIGAMIIAPLMLPIRGLAFGALVGNVALVRQGAISIAIGTLLAIAISWMLGALVGITLSCMLTFLIAGYAKFRHARRALSWTTVLTILLVIPLGVSFARLIRQAQLQTSLERALVNRTVTFQRLELLRTDVNWLSNPPTVRLNVRAKESVTPRQVQLLEEFISKEMEQPFTLIFEVGQVEEIRSSER